jgi:hypothetical protein
VAPPVAETGAGAGLSVWPAVLPAAKAINKLKLNKVKLWRIDSLREKVVLFEGELWKPNYPIRRPAPTSYASFCAGGYPHRQFNLSIPCLT